MTCKEFQDCLVLLAVNEAVEGEELETEIDQADFLRHIRNCKSCSEEFCGSKPN